MTVAHGVRVPAQRALAADAAAAAFVATGDAFASTTTNGWARVRDGVGAMVTGVPVPTLNGVVCARIGAVATAAAMLDEIAATGLPYCLQTRGGDAAGEMLARSRGMVESERVPFMLLDAAGVTVPDLEIRALGPGESDTHVDMVTAGFEAPPEIFAALRGSSLLRHDAVRGYVVEEGGVPVATALGITTGEHVGIFDVATLPSYRGRGYGAALTLRAVADGVAAGARTAFLQSSTMGLPVYERLGFRTVEEWTVWIGGPSA